MAINRLLSGGSDPIYARAALVLESVLYRRLEARSLVFGIIKWTNFVSQSRIFHLAV